MIDDAHIDRRIRATGGFSTIELALTMGVLLILAGFAVPSFMKAYHLYQLTDAASQVAGILRTTRFEAIRRNTTIACMITQTAAVPPLTRIWTDSNKDSAEDPGDAQIQLNGAVNLVDGGSVPGTAALGAGVGAQQGFATVPLANATLNFDQRGAVVTGGLYALYVANSSAPDAGYRAVILFPSGSLQIWQADGQGNWRFLK